jgi:hypothetical protein
MPTRVIGRSRLRVDNLEANFLRIFLGEGKHLGLRHNGVWNIQIYRNISCHGAFPCAIHSLFQRFLDLIWHGPEKIPATQGDGAVPYVWHRTWIWDENPLPTRGEIFGPRDPSVIRDVLGLDVVVSEARLEY